MDGPELSGFDIYLCEVMRKGRNKTEKSEMGNSYYTCNLLELRKTLIKQKDKSNVKDSNCRG